jgi:D-xylose transport system substrate-binding protein
VKNELTVTILKDIRELSPKAASVMDDLLQSRPFNDLKDYSLSEITAGKVSSGSVKCLFLPVVQITKDNIYEEVVKSDFQSYADVYRDIPSNQAPPIP